MSNKEPLLRWFSGLRDGRNLLRESPGQLAIAVAFGNFHTLIQRFARPWNLPIAEKQKNTPTVRKMRA